MLCVVRLRASCVFSVVSHRCFSKKKKKGSKNKQKMDLQKVQKWVDWELVAFTDEEQSKHKYKQRYGLTHLPEIIKDYGAVPEAIAGFTSEMDDEIDSATFETNLLFIDFLHETIDNYLHIAMESEEIPVDAEVSNGEIVALTDDRKGYYMKENSNILETCLIEDLLGHAALRDGGVIPNSWMPNAQYKIYSEDNGLCYFQPWLIARMADVIREKYSKTEPKEKEKDKEPTRIIVTSPIALGNTTKSGGFRVFRGFLGCSEVDAISKHSIMLYERIQRTRGEKVKTKTFMSHYHNLNSEEYYENLIIDENNGNTRQAQYFEKYGDSGHNLTYFQGRDNIPSFAQELFLSKVLEEAELEDYSMKSTWKFTFNTYSTIETNTMSGFGFHKDVPSNGDISLIYSLGSSSKFQIRETNENSDNQVITVDIHSNDLIIMKDESRWDYEHRVVPVPIDSKQIPLCTKPPIYRISMVLGCRN